MCFFKSSLESHYEISKGKNKFEGTPNVLGGVRNNITRERERERERERGVADLVKVEFR